MSIDNTVLVLGVEEMAYEFVWIMGRYQEPPSRRMGGVRAARASRWACNGDLVSFLAGWKSGGVDGFRMTAEFVVFSIQRES